MTVLLDLSRNTFYHKISTTRAVSTKLPYSKGGVL